jgi:uncharacterized membrane protein YheB (UPF0754 family)
MNSFPAYLAPPLVGAFIGYMTNYIAIRMLFRPLKPWRIMGLRLPLTPGVIPAKRHQLAGNIGEMVGEHLLTSDDIGRAIQDAAFQGELRQLLDSRLDEVLEKELGPVASLVPEHFASYFEVGVKILRWRFLKHLHGQVNSETFARQITAAVGRQLDDYLARDLNACLPGDRREHLYSILDSTISHFLASPDVHLWIRNTVKQQLDRFLDHGGSLGSLLPESMIQTMLDRLEQEVPGLLEKFARAVEEPPFQEKISKGIVGAIDKATASLGPLAALIRNAIPVAMIDQKVRSFLSDKSRDISGWLFDESVQRQTASILREKVRELLFTPASQLLADTDPRKIEEVRDWLADFVTETLKTRSIAENLTGLAREAFDSQSRRPLEDILHDLFGKENLATGKTWAAEEVVAVIRSPAAKGMLDKIVTELVEKKILPQPLGKLSTLLPKAVQAGISDYLLQQVNKLLVAEVPGLVDSLNLREIVSRKVNSLDLLRLENLLLSIMQAQFKYINLFGALLGFLIGLGNLFLLGFL